MYLFVCFILLVSLEGLKTSNTNTDPKNDTTGSTTSATIAKTTNFINNVVKTTPISTTQNSITFSTTKQESQKTSENPDKCLFNLKDNKEKLLWSLIALLLLICLLLLVIITCLVCKCCRGTRNNYPVVKKKKTRRNSVNGGPSETDVMLKDCSSVKVDIETTPNEPQEPVEVGGATAEVGNEVSSEENKTSASDIDETAPTQEVDQTGETDLKMENLEKAE